MSASAEMPYFIKPSVNLNESEKIQCYEEALNSIRYALADESNELIKMVTINCLLKTHLPYFYWVGFYLTRNGRLEVGPYQGTLGCLYIDFGKGVCGKVALTKQTEIVSDCHALEQGSEHIACDPNSQSEIVVPIIKSGILTGVFDVDSTLTGSFDQTDQKYLEQIMTNYFG